MKSQENKFKWENIIRLSISVRRTKKAVKSLMIDTSSLEIGAKEEDCTKYQSFINMKFYCKVRKDYLTLT